MAAPPLRNDTYPTRTHGVFKPKPQLFALAMPPSTEPPESRAKQHAPPSPTQQDHLSISLDNCNTNCRRLSFMSRQSTLALFDSLDRPVVLDLGFDVLDSLSITTSFEPECRSTPSQPPPTALAHQLSPPPSPLKSASSSSPKVKTFAVPADKVEKLIKATEANKTEDGLLSGDKRVSSTVTIESITPPSSTPASTANTPKRSSKSEVAAKVNTVRPAKRPKTPSMSGRVAARMPTPLHSSSNGLYRRSPAPSELPASKVIDEAGPGDERTENVKAEVMAPGAHSSTVPLSKHLQQRQVTVRSSPSVVARNVAIADTTVLATVPSPSSTWSKASSNVPSLLAPPLISNIRPPAPPKTSTPQQFPAAPPKVPPKLESSPTQVSSSRQPPQADTMNSNNTFPYQLRPRGDSEPLRTGTHNTNNTCQLDDPKTEFLAHIPPPPCSQPPPELVARARSGPSSIAKVVPIETGFLSRRRVSSASDASLERAFVAESISGVGDVATIHNKSTSLMKRNRISKLLAAAAVDGPPIPIIDLASFVTPRHNKAVQLTSDIREIGGPVLVASSSNLKTVPISEIKKYLKKEERRRSREFTRNNSQHGNSQQPVKAIPPEHLVHRGRDGLMPPSGRKPRRPVFGDEMSIKDSELHSISSITSTKSSIARRFFSAFAFGRRLPAESLNAHQGSTIATPGRSNNQLISLTEFTQATSSILATTIRKGRWFAPYLVASVLTRQ
ncbi:hypothetical protein SeMB42_g07914 [Synchytrium endobioticum]|uniref:Uncharacterized protein n=1 Tax=Synchytrium endobioticum TaxID=286115 RepID=A0A507BT03_9FUNG|nr:hypothetical protein SeMB42_g07914 [Synchytrium endobioticum]TPX34980.1 hypothetical protein SeLEV6574_g08226 [Synchytrium endobioticum]